MKRHVYIYKHPGETAWTGYPNAMFCELAYISNLLGDKSEKKFQRVKKYYFTKETEVNSLSNI